MRRFDGSDKTEVKRLAIQFFKFGLVGLSNTAVSMAVYYMTLWENPDWYLLGSVLGTILSIANAFFWNDRFVFAGNARDFFSVLRRLGKTYVSYGGTSALSVALLLAEVTFFHVSR
ncbi:MAG: GtrA family protein, partial [Oscillospiraceae bacterium]|nr:GtrA family protein [Oscillospiraceae bacterium]